MNIYYFDGEMTISKKHMDFRWRISWSKYVLKEHQNIRIVLLEKDCCEEKENKKENVRKKLFADKNIAKLKIA